MIAYLKGTVKFKGANFIVLENNGVGYKIFVPISLALKAKNGENEELYIYHHVREDASQLYGFRSVEDLNLFEKLISVSGVGPKTASGIFAEATASDIMSAIANQDPTVLKKISGIGAKTAERIILELKNKMESDFGAMKSHAEMNSDIDVVEALVNFGYSSQQAKEALKKVDPSVKNLGDKVKSALKNLNSKS